MTIDFQVSVADGKYVVQSFVNGPLLALRYGEPWRGLTGDGLVLALATELHHAREENVRLKAAFCRESPGS